MTTYYTSDEEELLSNILNSIKGTLPPEQFNATSSLASYIGNDKTLRSRFRDPTIMNNPATALMLAESLLSAKLSAWAALKTKDDDEFKVFSTYALQRLTENHRNGLGGMSRSSGTLLPPSVNISLFPLFELSRKAEEEAYISFYNIGQQSRSGRWR